MNKEIDNSENMLIDNFGRKIDYLRIAVTDRCNLRCVYCMPEEGIPFESHDSILSFEENIRLVKIFTSIGIKKVRITGGEPFVRKGLINFIEDIHNIENSPSIHITTNGVITNKYIDDLIKFGVAGVNLSLDTLKKDKFISITRRDEFESVQKTIYSILDAKLKLKINCVVQNGINDNEIISLAELAKDSDVEIRFIEEMPFNGYKKVEKPFSAKMIYDRLAAEFNIDEGEYFSNSTAKIFSIDGFKGKVGIIGGYSRSFCSSCNRIRITSTGMLKTCLYDNGVLDLRLLLRSGYSDEEIKNEILKKVKSRFENGLEAEAYYRKINNSSMASIGG